MNKNVNRKMVIILSLTLLLSGCAGEQIGDSIITENETCKTTMEYKWVWSMFEDSGFKKVPVTKCEPR